MPKEYGFWYVSPEKREQARRSMPARRHGPSIAYVNGKPFVLQILAKEMGCTVNQLADRVRRYKQLGKPLTEEMLRRPFPAPSPRKPASPENLRRRLRLD